MLIKDLCKQKYLKVLKEGDKTMISVWKKINSMVNTSYNEGYEDGQQNRQITNS